MSSSATVNTTINVTPNELLFSLVEWLNQMKNEGSQGASLINDTESLDVAIETLSSAANLNINDQTQQNQWSIKRKYGYDLLSVVDAGVKVLNKASELHHNTAGAAADTTTPSASIPSFQRFQELLEGKGFFKGVTVGTPEYNERIKKAKETYEQKYGNKINAAHPATATIETTSTTTTATSSSTSTSSKQYTPTPVSDDDRRQAENCKNEGNAALAKGQYQDAVDMYELAIGMNPNSAIYYANKAAALINLKRYNEAIDDCDQSTSIDPQYGKAHYRRGQALLHTGRASEAVEAFERALKLMNNDATVREQLNIATQRAASGDTSAYDGTRGGAGKAAASASASASSSARQDSDDESTGDGNDFMSMMNNPMFQNMMNNPELQKTLSGLDPNNLDIGSLLSNPQLMQMASSMMGGMFGGGGAGSGSGSGWGADIPSLSSSSSSGESGAPTGGGATPDEQLRNLMNSPQIAQLRNDPEMRPIVDDVQRNGMGALSKYMNNPKVMAKLSSLMGALGK